MKIFDSRKSLIVMLLSALLTVCATEVFQRRDAVLSLLQKKKIEPILELSEDSVELNTDDVFDASKYVQKATDSSDNDVSDKVSGGTINTAKAGKYEVIYRLTDNGKEVTKKLTVVVKPKSSSAAK